MEAASKVFWGGASKDLYKERAESFPFRDRCRNVAPPCPALANFIAWRSLHCLARQTCATAVPQIMCKSQSLAAHKITHAVRAARQFSKTPTRSVSACQVCNAPEERATHSVLGGLNVVIPMPGEAVCIGPAAFSKTLRAPDSDMQGSDSLPAHQRDCLPGAPASL